MSNDLLQAVGEVAAACKEIKEKSATKAELDEKLGKVQADLVKVQEALRADVTRATAGEPMGAVKHLRDLGVKSPRDLTQIRRWKDASGGQATIQPVVSDDVVAALELADHVYMADRILNHQVKGKFDQRKSQIGERAAWKERADKCKGTLFPNLFDRWDRFTRDLAAATGKALSSTAGGAGDEWVPTNFASNLLEIVRVETPFVGLFPVVTMTSNPWTNPVQSTVGKAYIRTENTAVTEGTMATANKTWTAYPFANYQAYSDEVDEDSVISVIPSMRADMIRSLSEGLEKAITSGDTVTTHFDTDYEALGATEVIKAAFNGLRAFFHESTLSSGVPKINGGGAKLTTAICGDMLTRLGKYGARKSADCAFALNSASFLHLITESPTTSAVVTVDRYGPSATIVTGELARIFGVPILISFGVEERMNAVDATGVNAASGNTLSMAILVNRAQFALGDRRDVRFETDKDITAGKNQMVATARWAFQPKQSPSATVTSLVEVFNID